VWRRERVGRTSVEAISKVVVSEDLAALSEVMVGEDPAALTKVTVAEAWRRM
jgi:hypothetical protein